MVVEKTIVSSSCYRDLHSFWSLGIRLMFFEGNEALKHKELLFVAKLFHNCVSGQACTRRRSPRLFFLCYYLNFMFTEMVVQEKPETLNSYQDIMDKENMTPIFANAFSDINVFSNEVIIRLTPCVIQSLISCSAQVYISLSDLEHINYRE